ncbi:MAG: helix-turn-helix domain-containing protein [Actinomycetota bacterium]
MATTVVPDTVRPNGLNELSEQELAVLRVLVRFSGRVVSRAELARQSGLGDRSARRCDAILVEIRRRLGPESIRTVRSRGWMLTADAADAARTLVT